MPFPNKLQDLDHRAFRYYFEQIRADFCSGRIIRTWNECGSVMASGSETPTTARKKPLFGSIMNPDSNDNGKRVKLYKIVANLASYIMSVDVLENEKSVKEVIKNLDNYVPKDTYASSTSKFMGSGKLKSVIESVINNYLDRKLPASNLKLFFLCELERSFPNYFEESYRASFEDGSSSVSVFLIFRPPFKDTNSPFEEKEPTLVMMEEMNGKKIGQEHHVCLIEELCNISVRRDDQTGLEISRKNGIPIYFTMNSQADSLSFLSLMSGYYRLCEKWSFVLSNLIIYPHLQFNLAHNVHGPVTTEFVTEKFQCKAKGKAGTYLLRQSCEEFDRYHLHYLESGNSKVPEILTIDKMKSGKLFKLHLKEGDMTFETLRDIIKYLKEPTSDGSKIQNHPCIRDCLHPSEFDKATTLLLCRSIAKLRADMLGEGGEISEPKLLIPFKHLSRFENEKLEGKFTKVWRGLWHKKKNIKEEVAIKQLNENYQNQKLADFSHTNYNVSMWNDSTLVTAFGICLNTHTSPMALVMEYFSLGTLDKYLRYHPLQDVDLVEACASLARALWYLEENDNIRHGHIRCKNVFVAYHDSTSFKVKLGDPSVSDSYEPSDVHWLPLELLLHPKPSPSQCTIKGDVWALGTTYWQIFSHGDTPLPDMDPDVAKWKYIRGERLDRPILIKGYLGQLYEVMRDCWNPNPDLRKDPQSIMRDTNQLLYRVFNTRHVHSYMTVEDGDTSSVSSSSTATTITIQNQMRNGSQDLNSEDTLLTNLDSSCTPSKAASINGTSSSNYSRLTSQNMVPTYNEMMTKFREQQGEMISAVGNLMSDELFSNSDSSEPLLSSSRPGSSLEGSLFQTDMSQFTSQTSLASYSTLYSMSSIYQLSSESQLELNMEFPLGEGNFGVVYKGVMSRSNDEWDQVAVKKLKESSLSEAAEEMRRELDIMMGLSHDNVVRIKGVLHDEMIIIMEYLREGSLDRYLNVHRDTVDLPQLLTYAGNIIEGMKYLGQQGIIHRDLAARNILVANEEVVKISDFGLARTVDNDHYVMSSNTNIPVKWLALECLTHKLFTFASDVWSFGITLWEMFTYGSTPFLNGCENFFKVGSKIYFTVHPYCAAFIQFQFHVVNFNLIAYFNDINSLYLIL